MYYIVDVMVSKDYEKKNWTRPPFGGSLSQKHFIAVSDCCHYLGNKPKLTMTTVTASYCKDSLRQTFA